ncbi:hypothetical protein AEAC466_14070 [Asticcacaulis sp. AC466]|uniref:DciA family protein n=1 Tax=Asticcacaulis sp. AC466 TaxID=1282362 RepID=UPI0003C3CF82|nr:DciA family protein [Asticcacaulis sp. AC466]ESQ83371.1 hypothetical protein AEAC466_14070 [Asticcacaulis sp. AC466]
MKRELPSLEESVRILRTTRTRRTPKAPPAVQKQVQPLLKSLQSRFEAMDDGSGKLKNRWNEIVGENLAKLSEPVRIVKGRQSTSGALEIRVANSTHATLITHNTSTLIDRINLFLGARTIERIRIIQGVMAQPKTRAPIVRPKPLSAQEELGLQQSLADVTDDKLKKTLLKLGRSVLKRENMK